MNNVSKRHHKSSINWEKILYSSIIFGTLYAGGQYLSAVQVQASGNNQSSVSSNTSENDSWDSQPVTISEGGEVYFDNDYAYQYPDAENFDTPYNFKNIIAGPDNPNEPGIIDPGSTIDTSYALQYLKDKGFETSNIPSTVTMQNKNIYIQMKSVDHRDGFAQFKLVDFNGNYIKSYYDLPSSNYNIDNLINKIRNDGYNVVYRPSSSIIDTTNTNQVYDLIVQMPYHVLSINLIDSTNNKIVTKYLYAVTDYGTTSTDYVKNRLDAEFSFANPNDILKNIPNKETNYDIIVNRTSQFDPSSEDSYGYDDVRDIPDIDNVSSAEGNDDSYNPTENEFHTKVNFVDKSGKLLDSAIFSNRNSNLVYTRFTHLFTADKYMDDNVIPTVLDLDKGPYTFTVSDSYLSSHGDNFIHDDSINDEWREGESKKLLDENQAALNNESSDSSTPSNNQSVNKDTDNSETTTSATTQGSPSNQASTQSQVKQQPSKSSAQPAPAPAPKPAPVVQSHPAAAPASTAKAAPAPQPAKAKPSKSQLKAVAKSYKQSKHAVKTDTAKLKALKKKMKKHATKKQKAAYKALQIKLAADKKAVKSYKAQEGKLTKYFKEVAVINRENKQIKSLTAQLKKLKKKHSKANKKKAAKVQKALKKANNSLKAATKFVNDYK
ncbi:hypothetical protein RZ54_06650 [Apilactobacillus kunkeei]|uniref:hypothetical protein n=1 Tax=Apilactobacillus kunkeei TaxID=148814 RepID=UPI0006C2127C|nr:hypothetical protein [Apilactobacillus kunkeei]KOY76437.1 hypothetical protein RZ54_06650 [Apilactobacillus kunkeei]